MKKAILLLLTLFYFSLSQAQIVNIPDANFKSKLLAANTSNTIATNLSEVAFDIDSNNDGQIQVSEALQVKRLNVDQSNIANLTGITSFTNLEELSISTNLLTSFDLHGITNLQKLYCSNNNFGSLDITYLTNLKIFFAYNSGITSLVVAGMTNLETLICNHNEISTINLLGLTHILSIECGDNPLQTLAVNHLTTLHGLNCSNNMLSTLNVSNLIHLENLGCYNNQLTTLDVSHNPNLTSFSCSYNQLTTIDLTNLTKLQYSQFKGNLFTELDFSHVTQYLPSSYHEYSFEDNPNLVYVNIKNGQSDYVYFNSQPLNCPNLHYICADEIDMTTVLNAMQQASITAIQVNTYCTFSLGGAYNTIIGNLTIDTDNDGCDEDDLYFPGIRINLNDGTNSGATFTDTSGNFTFYNLSGNYTITPIIQTPSYFAISPPTVTLNFPVVNRSTQTQSFCVTPIGQKNDVDIVILPLGPARPGFDASYQLVYKNKGNQVMSGSINLTFNDAIFDFIIANPTLASQSTDNLNWNYSNLMPFESRSITFTLNLNGPTETPAVNIGDILNFEATINPIPADQTPSDNVFNLSQIVRGSYDPNDKICLEGTSISTAKVGDYLDYIIHFQNSGTAPAENIVVKDLIDTTKFDISSLQIISSSHSQVTRLTGNKVEFIFEGINLPAEISNEPASHGFVAFKIKTKSNLVIGNTITNKANIYFDYNSIITNLASTTVAALGVNEFENKLITIYPNPAKNKVTISAEENITSVQLFDVQGKLIVTELNNSTEANLDLSQQQTGIYFVKVYTDNGMKVQKVIKQ